MDSNSPGTISSTTPNGGSSRTFSLDVLRGIAVLGILITAIWELGGFTINKQTFFRTGTHGGNYALFSWMDILFDGKMVGLFALVFGAGLIIYALRPAKTSISAPDLYIRRKLWLLLFGIFVAVCLLWPGDILYHFAILGILLFPFCRMSSKGLLIASLVAMLIYSGKIYWDYADDQKALNKYLAVKTIEKTFVTSDSLVKKKVDSLARVHKNNPFSSLDPLLERHKTDTLTKLQSRDKENWEGIAKRLKYDSTADGATNKAMHSTSYGKIWNYVLPKSQERESWWLYRRGVWDIGSVMLLGMALLGFGFFDRRYSAGKYFLIAIITLVAGIALAWFRNDWNNTRLPDYEKYISGHSIPYNLFLPLERILMVLGYASLFMSLLRLNFLGRLWQVFGTVGRMAYSNYSLQIFFATFFFYGYGMGYFGRLSQLKLYLIVAELWLLQVLFSYIWLKYFTMGPVEWLWRCLIHRQWLPLKKDPAGSDAPSSSPIPSND